MTFKLRVEGFRDRGDIPAKYTCDGENVSPALSWEAPPLTARSFVLIVDDPDAPAGTWTHWLLWDIPAETNHLPEGFQPGVSGTNDFGRRGYGGPCPPRGHGVHRYYFTLYALDLESLDLPAGAHRADLDAAIRGRTLAEAQYMGRYERR